ncbi:MAG: hypothetical protein HYT40_03725 [Candidatus Sungbacteria bacterium]|uniref:Uncharacterized protein n=1 Tax=Candidatus Sungiibacteriota bacterium TaxID=2750080 RepID=A0A931WPQ6_9BACT|nr:hypothetical protein [Candidatus Sungbacteria bacterium]
MNDIVILENPQQDDILVLWTGGGGERRHHNFQTRIETAILFAAGLKINALVLYRREVKIRLALMDPKDDRVFERLLTECGVPCSISERRDTAAHPLPTERRTYRDTSMLEELRRELTSARFTPWTPAPYRRI